MANKKKTYYIAQSIRTYLCRSTILPHPPPLRSTNPAIGVLLLGGEGGGDKQSSIPELSTAHLIQPWPEDVIKKKNSGVKELGD